MVFSSKNKTKGCRATWNSSNEDKGPVSWQAMMLCWLIIVVNKYNLILYGLVKQYLATLLSGTWGSTAMFLSHSQYFFKIILNNLIKEKALKTHTIPYHYLLTARGRLQSEPPLATTKLKNWLDLSGTIIKKQYVPATRWPSSGLQSLAENTFTGPVWQSQASRCNFCEDSPLLGLGPCPLDLWLWNFNPNNIILNLSKAIIVI